MTVSSVTSFNMTADQLVTAALRKLAVLGDGQAPTTTQLSTGREALNVMLKTFQTKGMPLWAIAESSVPLTATRTYPLSYAPLKVLQAIRMDATDGSTVSLESRTHYDYNLLSNTLTTGQATTYWYEPLNQTGVLHIWPTPDTYAIAHQSIKLVYQRPFYDITTGADTLDFPQFWLEAVIYGLAQRLAPEFGIPLQDRQMYVQEATLFLNEALSFGTEEGSLFIQPDWTKH